MGVDGVGSRLVEGLMKHWVWKQGWLFGLVSVVFLAAVGCGDDGTGTGGMGTGGVGGGGGGMVSPELFGTWSLATIATQGMSENCPGEIDLNATESISCGTQTDTFNSDGTFVEIQTTDELGDPDPFRSEGTWSTDGNMLTITYLRDGPDENNLTPLVPPETQTGTWSVAGTTLTLMIMDPELPGITITGTLQKQ